MINFSQNFIKLFEDFIFYDTLKNSDFFKSIGFRKSNIYLDDPKLLSEKLLKLYNKMMLNLENFSKEKTENIREFPNELISHNEYGSLIFSVTTCIKMSYEFILSGRKIYKFNDDFLEDFLNYDLDLTLALEKNKTKFMDSCIFICAKDIAIVKSKLNDDIIKFNSVFVFKQSIFDEVTNSYINTIRFIFNDLEKGFDEPFSLSKKFSSEFSLVNVLKDEYYDNYLNKKVIFNEDKIIHNILKLLLYIQTSNVDLRKISPEFPKTNTRKERDRTNTINIKNDSLINYFKVGYGWQKLPIYIQEQWGVRGHFRLQPCGQNRENHKIIFIEPQVRQRKFLETETII